MKKLISLIFVLFICTNLNSQDLPKYMTEKEKELWRNYSPPVYQTDDYNPPYSPVRTMAEWEEFQAVQITWTSYLPILAQMVDYIQDECLVLIVCSDSNSVKSYLTSNGVPLVNLRFLYASFNSVWCRDYGAWTIYTNNIDSMRMIDWVYNRPRPQDDLIPVYVANYFNVLLHQMTQEPNRIVATGGNFMVDGHGIAFSSKLILNENPNKTEAEIDTMFRKYMGIKTYIKMNTLPYDGIHHIDMHMKLLDEETLLVGQYPVGVADGPQIDSNLRYVTTNFQTCFNRPWKVVRIPMPPNSNGQYPPNSYYFTYTNSLIVNKTVIVPIYNFPQDTTALRIYREAMPGYRVVGINSNSIIPASGAIHCISKEVGVYNPIFISHPSIRLATTTMPNYEVKAYIKTKGGISNAKVFWTIDTNLGFNVLNMSAVGDTFRAYIPAQPLGTKVYYYISATASLNNRTVTKPLTAPSGNFRFTVTTPTNVSGEEQLLNTYLLQQNYPNPFNPSTTIDFSIAKDENIKLSVYDLTGKEIVVLVNEFRKAGAYRIIFIPSNYNLSSGIYFYKLETKNYSAIRKMIFIK
ncbi:MAG: agmatine deiminase family protein [Ignavibacteria bacterium]|nr:agmatine deiminase family protein [Ignavibacteria bacterium]